MEELALKYVEFGALGVITLLLITKGLTTLNNLSDSYNLCAETTKRLADAISKLTDKITATDNRVEHLSYRLSGIESKIDRLADKLELLERADKNDAKYFRE